MPMRLNALTLSLCLYSGIVQGHSVPLQNKPEGAKQPTGQQTSQPVPAATPALTGFGLEDGTPVNLRLTRHLSSGTDKNGDTADFEVLEDVSVSGVLVVPTGSAAAGTITAAQHTPRMRRGG